MNQIKKTLILVGFTVLLVNSIMLTANTARASDTKSESADMIYKRE